MNVLGVTATENWQINVTVPTTPPLLGLSFKIQSAYLSNSRPRTVLASNALRATIGN